MSQAKSDEFSAVIECFHLLMSYCFIYRELYSGMLFMNSKELFV